jgi:hypothetical protein
MVHLMGTALKVALSGVVAGVVGIGGGLLMAPMLLDAGIHPQVSRVQHSIRRARHTALSIKSTKYKATHINRVANAGSHSGVKNLVFPHRKCRPSYSGSCPLHHQAAPGHARPGAHTNACIYTFTASLGLRYLYLMPAMLLCAAPALPHPCPVLPPVHLCHQQHPGLHEQQQCRPGILPQWASTPAIRRSVLQCVWHSLSVGANRCGAAGQSLWAALYCGAAIGPDHGGGCSLQWCVWVLGCL